MPLWYVSIWTSLTFALFAWSCRWLQEAGWIASAEAQLSYTCRSSALDSTCWRQQGSDVQRRQSHQADWRSQTRAARRKSQDWSKWWPYWLSTLLEGHLSCPRKSQSFWSCCLTQPWGSWLQGTAKVGTQSHATLWETAFCPSWPLCRAVMILTKSLLMPLDICLSWDDKLTSRFIVLDWLMN